MQDPLLERAIQRNHGQAGAMNINGTPAFVIGERLIPGAASLEQLLDLVKTERDRQLSAALLPKKD
jgi:protein-disulfide isomerase